MALLRQDHARRLRLQSAAEQRWQPVRQRADLLVEQNYIDLTLNFTVHNNLNFRVGVDNVFDKDPPLTGTNCTAGVCNGNTYPQVYDQEGRYVFVGLTADF